VKTDVGTSLLLWLVLIVCAGQKTCMHVHGIFPYLFVRYYASAEPSSTYLQEFAEALDRAINIALGSAASTRQHVYKISLVSGMSVFVTFSYLYCKCYNRYRTVYSKVDVDAAESFVISRRSYPF